MATEAETITQLMTLLTQQRQANERPPQPARVEVYDAVTAEPRMLYRIDAREQMARGMVVDDPKKAKKPDPKVLAAAKAAQQRQEAEGLEALEIEELRKLWRALHEDQEPNPRLGTTRLIKEIEEARAAVETADKGAEGGGTGEDGEE
jgi:hypothetical protein